MTMPVAFSGWIPLPTAAAGWMSMQRPQREGGRHGEPGQQGTDGQRRGEVC
jgi:hypothetical protein